MYDKGGVRLSFPEGQGEAARHKPHPDTFRNVGALTSMSLKIKSLSAFPLHVFLILNIFLLDSLILNFNFWKFGTVTYF